MHSAGFHNHDLNMILFKKNLMITEVVMEDKSNIFRTPCEIDVFPLRGKISYFFHDVDFHFPRMGCITEHVYI